MIFNRERAERYMREAGLEAIVAAAWPNIFYLTGYACWIDPLFREYMMRPGGTSDAGQAYAVLAAGEAPRLIIGPTFAANAEGIAPEHLYCHGSFGLDESRLGGATPAERGLAERMRAGRAFATPTEALAAALRDGGISPARVGLDREGLTLRSREEIAATFGPGLMRNCSNLLRLIRMAKTEGEIARLRRGATIAEEAVEKIFAGADAETDLLELRNRFHAEIAARGAEFDHFAYSPRGLGIATSPSHRLGREGISYFDYGVAWRGYFSDSGLTICGSLPDAGLMRMHDALRAALEAGVAEMRPGRRASAIREVMRERLAEAGIGESFPHGHGLGLEVRDYPILVEDTGLRIKDDCIDVAADLPLEENMVLNVEASCFLPGCGSLNIETSHLVTAGGAEPLIAQDRARPLVIGGGRG